MTSSPRIPGHRFLHSPGPSRVPEEVQDALTRQPMDLADPRVDELIAECESGLKRILGCGDADVDVFLYATNGHGAWEAVIANLLGPGRAVLVPGTGHFANGWAEQSEALGARVISTPWVEGQPIDAAAVEQALREDTAHEIVAVFAVHTDTASGVTSDMAALRRAITAAGHPALFVVDMVASFATAPLDMRAVGADVVLGASQKGLMSPPGLGFVAVNPRAFEVAAANPAPRFYWDWRLRQSPFSYRKFCGTPPHNLLAGLRAALGLIFQEGLPQVYARHALLAGAVHAAVARWAEAGALSFFCRVPACRATAVTTILIQGCEPDALRTVAREQFQVSIAGGLGPLTGRVFRIGHLGDLNPAMVLGCLGGVDAALKQLRVPVGAGAVDAAVDFLNQQFSTR